MPNKTYELDLDKYMILDIMDNCFGNIFVVDATSKIIFANENCVNAFGVPRDRIIGYTTQNLIDSGILTRSTSQECLKTRETVIGIVKSQLGIEMLNVSKPVYDENGNPVENFDELYTEFCEVYGQNVVDEFISSVVVWFK